MKQRYRKYKECPKCNGEGLINKKHSNGKIYPDFCSKCKGKGRI